MSAPAVGSDQSSVGQKSRSVAERATYLSGPEAVVPPNSYIVAVVASVGAEISSLVLFEAFLDLDSEPKTFA